MRQELQAVSKSYVGARKALRTALKRPGISAPGQRLGFDELIFFARPEGARGSSASYGMPPIRNFRYRTEGHITVVYVVRASG